MFLPTIKVTDISEKWRSAIRANQAIADFCLLKYNLKSLGVKVFFFEGILKIENFYHVVC